MSFKKKEEETSLEIHIEAFLKIILPNLESRNSLPVLKIRVFQSLNCLLSLLTYPSAVQKLRVQYSWIN